MDVEMVPAVSVLNHKAKARASQSVPEIGMDVNPDSVLGQILSGSFQDFEAAVAWAQKAVRILAKAATGSDFEKLTAFAVVLSECPVSIPKCMATK